MWLIRSQLELKDSLLSSLSRLVLWTSFKTMSASGWLILKQIYWSFISAVKRSRSTNCAIGSCLFTWSALLLPSSSCSCASTLNLLTCGADKQPLQAQTQPGRCSWASAVDLLTPLTEPRQKRNSLCSPHPGKDSSSPTALHFLSSSLPRFLSVFKNFSASRSTFSPLYMLSLLSSTLPLLLIPFSPSLHPLFLPLAGYGCHGSRVDLLFCSGTQAK